MSISTANKDIRTHGYVIRRTNYGEADRILNIITPSGKMTVMARGVRKEKSKLAGSVELFSLTDFVIHFGKGDMGVLTGARMLNYYGNILKSFDRMELAGQILKKISIAADSSDNSDYYNIVDQSLRALNDGMRINIVEGWFWLNLMKAMGEEANLYRDSNGEKLLEQNRYNYDVAEGCFAMNPNGLYGADEIKFLRLLSSADLSVITRVKNVDKVLDSAMGLVRILAKK